MSQGDSSDKLQFLESCHRFIAAYNKLDNNKYDLSDLDQSMVKICPKCCRNSLLSISKQARAIDEEMTNAFKCVECEYKC